MRILFVRHAEPDYSDDTLTEKGKREAELLAKRAKEWKVKDIYVSPFGRAKETAEPLVKALDITPVTLPWLREYSYKVINPIHGNSTVPWDFIPTQVYEDEKMISQNDWVFAGPNASNDEIKSNYPIVIKGLDELVEKYGIKRVNNHYERIDGRKRRIVSTIKDMKFATADDLPIDDSEPTIVIVCHFGVICLMLSRLLNIPFELLTHGFILPTSSVTIVNTEERWDAEVSFRVQAMGDCMHLLTKNEPISNAASFARLFQQ